MRTNATPDHENPSLPSGKHEPDQDIPPVVINLETDAQDPNTISDIPPASSEEPENPTNRPPSPKDHKDIRAYLRGLSPLKPFIS
ncbi:MAG TPA: hypothetical protein P5229_00770 [Candidatus Gracilibacteria bacterium]|nr:hypothetical protein [Candidatus Gracilibacteria bacterium]HRY90863.1 hypothetical protein [Candidatus Gracilibacteria bacterium]